MQISQKKVAEKKKNSYDTDDTVVRQMYEGIVKKRKQFWAHGGPRGGQRTGVRQSVSSVWKALEKCEANVKKSCRSVSLSKQAGKATTAVCESW